MKNFNSQNDKNQKILNKIYQLESAVENLKDEAGQSSDRNFPPKIKIHIRKKGEESELQLPRPLM